MAERDTLNNLTQRMQSALNKNVEMENEVLLARKQKDDLEKQVASGRQQIEMLTSLIAQMSKGGHIPSSSASHIHGSRR